MMDERIDRGRNTISDEELGKLIASAGPRAELPELDLAAIRAKTCAVWEHEVRGSKRASQRAWFLRLGVAAAVAGALLLVWLLRDRAVPSAPVEVATVELVTGSVTMHVARGQGIAIAQGDRLVEGATLATGNHASRVALRLSDGVTIRFDEASTATLVSASIVRLDAGALYVDTGARTKGGESSAIEIQTESGSARDIGTQFEVRVLENTGAMLVRVREGRVAVEKGRTRGEAAAGRELVLEPNGRISERAANGWGDGWAWILAASPRFDIEGRTLAEFLDWAGRETGWTISFSDPAIEARASGITLHGTIESSKPDEAPFAVLAGSGLEGTLTDGVLLIRDAKGTAGERRAASGDK